MFTKVLIANRGAIACRIIRTLRKMGVGSVAVFSDADAGSLHVSQADEAVRIGPPPAAQSYLDVDAILAAAKATGAIKAGATPGGRALKAVHHGPYSGFADTYAAIEAEMKDEGVPQDATMWEIYLGEPGITPDADLVTEIYFPVSATDAAKFPTE